MTLADILTLSKAGFTSQQITAMNQQAVQPIQQAVQPQSVQYVPVQQAAQQVMQAQPVQYTQPQPVQYVQPNSIMASQVQQAQAPAQVQQAQAPAQVQQAQAPAQAGAGYVPILPPTAQADPMKDIMLQNYMNVPGANMYNVHDVVADMIGATAPAGMTQAGGNK